MLQYDLQQLKQTCSTSKKGEKQNSNICISDLLLQIFVLLVHKIYDSSPQSRQESFGTVCIVASPRARRSAAAPQNLISLTTRTLSANINTQRLYQKIVNSAFTQWQHNTENRQKVRQRANISHFFFFF